MYGRRIACTRDTFFFSFLCRKLDRSLVSNVRNMCVLLAKTQETCKQQEAVKQPERNGQLDEETLIANRVKLAQKMAGQKKKADKQ